MNLEWLLERQLAWISQADSKLSVLGPLPLAMMAVSFSSIPINLRELDWADFPFVMSALLLSLSLFFVKAALSPRLKGPVDSLVYFGEISKVSSEEFAQKVASSNEASFQDDILKQIHINAKIAEQKHRNIGFSVLWLAIATPVWLLAIVLGG